MKPLVPMWDSIVKTLNLAQEDCAVQKEDIHYKQWGRDFNFETLPQEMRHMDDDGSQKALHQHEGIVGART